MRDFLNIGSTPCNEDCAQVGSEGYQGRAIDECTRFIYAIKSVLGNPPEGAELEIKSFSHDFGRYYEVVCWYNDEKPESVDYAYKCESDAPSEWPVGYATKEAFLEILNANVTATAA